MFPYFLLISNFVDLVQQDNADYVKRRRERSRKYAVGKLRGFRQRFALAEYLRESFYQPELYAEIAQRDYQPAEYKDHRAEKNPPPRRARYEHYHKAEEQSHQHENQPAHPRKWIEKRALSLRVYRARAVDKLRQQVHGGVAYQPRGYVPDRTADQL